MTNRLVSIVALALFVTSTISFAENKAAYAENDTWWVGKGATENTYYNYMVQHIDTNNGRPFLISIYFQKQDGSGRWIAPIFVQDMGKVIQGTLLLGQNLAVERGPGSNISSDLDPYLTAYANSLEWLNAFSPQTSPRKLSDTDWGKLGCIGCGDLLPSGPQKITVPAGTYDTTVLIAHYGQSDNKIWVNQDVPYPVNATFYAATTERNPPIQYAFELVQTGQGPPTVPKSEIRPVMPPLKLNTADDKYKIQLDWMPVVIQPQGNVSFTINFFDNTGLPVNAIVNYKVVVMDGNGTVLQTKDDQNTDSQGVGKQTLSFPSPGPVTVEVTVNAVANLPPTEIIEKADFPLVVVPEFPASATVSAAFVVVIALVLARRGLATLYFPWKK